MRGKDTSDSPAVQLGEYAVRQAQRLRKNVGSAAESGDVDAVHDLRVASRRLHEALRVVSPGDFRRSKVIRRDARELRQAFRKVRDLDVMIASLADMELDPGTRARLEGLLVARRERRLKRAIDVAGQVSTRRLQKQVKSLVAKLKDGEKVASRAAQMFGERAGQLAALDPGEASNADLHPARIAIKRVRYAAELLERAGGHGVDQLLEQLARMQDRLGHWNDCVTAARRLAKLAQAREELVDTPWSEKLLGLSASYLRAANRDHREVVEHWPELISAVTALADLNGSGTGTHGERQLATLRREEQLTP